MERRAAEASAPEIMLLNRSYTCLYLCVLPFLIRYYVRYHHAEDFTLICLLSFAIPVQTICYFICRKKWKLN